MRDYDNIPLRNLIRSKHNRRNLTPAEKTLWYKLKSSQQGAKFRRQHAIGNYIVDFVSLEHKLVIEIDGPTHGEDSQRAYDERRSFELEGRGFKILRFTNGEVFRAMDFIIESIKSNLHKA